MTWQELTRLRDLGSYRVPDALRSDAGFDHAAALFAEDLEGLTPDQVREGFRAFRRSDAQFWPTPGQIRKLSGFEVPAMDPAEVFERVRRMRGTVSDDEARGMAYLADAGLDVRAIGAGVSALGGWSAMGQIPDPYHGGSQIGYDAARARFTAAYLAVRGGASHLREVR